jgi:NAD-dependent SIR2 family protein deacetylase
MAGQARCDKCKLRFVWDKGYILWIDGELPICPHCGSELRRTTYLSKYKVEQVELVRQRGSKDVQLRKRH